MRTFANLIESIITVYHGSSSPIEKFDNKKQLSGYYPGFYTTSDLNRANSFGQNIHSYEVDSSKFYILKDGDILKKEAEKSGIRTSNGSGYPEVQYLKSLGFDGLVRGNEYIIFDPDKSILNHK